MLQKGIVDSMFFLQTNAGAFPTPANSSDPQAVYQKLADNVGAHYADYLRFTSGLSFQDLKAALSTFPAAQQQALIQLLMPATHVAEQDYRNNVLYTTRLRLNLRTEITPGMSFSGRLAMQKVWGDECPACRSSTASPTRSTAMAQPLASRTATSCGSIAPTSTGAASLAAACTFVGPASIHERSADRGSEGRLRGGTPLGHVVDYQFDGVTVGFTSATSCPERSGGSATGSDTSPASEAATSFARRPIGSRTCTSAA
jgi:hypothetical protein